jgi:hypothetical protein
MFFVTSLLIVWIMKPIGIPFKHELAFNDITA